MATKNDPVKLAVANRCSFWLETPLGYKEYGKPSNFFNFTSENNPAEMQILYDGLTWMKDKIYNITDDKKPAPYLFVKKVTNGKAAALYSYAPFVVNADGSIDTRRLASLENNIVTTITKWANDNKQVPNQPVYQSSLDPKDPLYSDERFLVQTIDLIPQTTTSL